MAKYKVLYTDTGKDDIEIEAEVLRKIDADLVLASSMDEETIIKEGMDCDGVLILYADVNKRVLDAWGKNGKVKVVSRQGIGYDNIDVEAATANGIMVGNVPDYCFTEVADHSMALALALLRQLKSFDHRVANGEWSENPIWPMSRLGTLNFGLFGVGGIARRVAKRAQGFDFNVMAYDPFQSKEELEKIGIEKIDTLEELVSKVDVLSMHAPNTDQTRHSINADMLKRMKKTSIIINTARGPLIKLDDLMQALRDGTIGGAGLDVLENEPPDEAIYKELCAMDNVIVTSHMGFYSQESDDELRMRIAENVALALTEGEPRSFVNRKQLGR